MKEKPKLDRNAPFFALPRQLQLNKKQQEKLAKLKEEYAPRLDALHARSTKIMTPERKKASWVVAKAGRKDGKKGKDLQDAIAAALKLTEDEKAALKESNQARSQLVAEIQKKLALLTATFPQNGQGPELEAHQVLLAPIITEKGTHQSQHRHAYPFQVNSWATKLQIKAAVEEMFNVRVDKVRTQHREGKKRRYRFRVGRLSNWKKAIVSLHKDSPAIEYF